MLAAALAANPLSFSKPSGAVRPASPWATDTTPVRQPLPAPHIRLAGYTYACSDCHAIISSPEQTDRRLTQHTHIELQHGINTHCFNCHHRTQRDVFAGYLNEPIPWDQPHLLCAKCHGPVYRDWQHGAHGRTNGYWDVSRGPQTRRTCIECHDPHQPAFRPLKPARGPQTLYMARQDGSRQDTVHGPLCVAGHSGSKSSIGEGL